MNQGHKGDTGAQGPAGPTQELQVRTVLGDLVTVPSGQVGKSWASCAPDELATGGGTTTNNPSSNQVNTADVDFGTRTGNTGPEDAPNQWFFQFLKAGKSMLLIFNPENTMVSTNSIFPVHGAITPPSSIHFALEIEQADYEVARNILIQNGISIEKEMSWGSGGKSIYFRDPVGNLVEFVTKGQWPVQD